MSTLSALYAALANGEPDSVVEPLRRKLEAELREES